MREFKQGDFVIVNDTGTVCIVEDMIKSCVFLLGLNSNRINGFRFPHELTLITKEVADILKEGV